MHSEPIMDLAHLAHPELLTPKPEEGLQSFIDIMGMTAEAERKKGQAWGLKTIESFHTYGTPPVETVSKR